MSAPERRNKSVQDEAEAKKAGGVPRPDRAKEFFPHCATVPAALEAAQIGIWSWDAEANIITWSRNLEALHRLPEGGFDGSQACFERQIRRADLPGVQASFTEALRTGGRSRVRYRLRKREGGGDHWLESSGTVAEGGAPDRMIGICLDVTERVSLENELRGRINQQEALAQLGERALTERNLERFLDDAVSTVAVTLGVDFVKILELLPGGADLMLRAGFGWNVGMAGSVVASAAPGSHARHILDSASPVVTADFAEDKSFVVASYLKDHGCVSGVNVTIGGRDDDRSYGILGACTKAKRQFGAHDVAFLAAVANLLAGAVARRQLEQRNELMIREMRHRSGNLFSQLLALFSQTARTSKNIADLSGKYQARVLALANAHRLITEGGWRSIPIIDLLYVLLGPYLDRTTLNGPNVELEPDPVFHLSAALHELADNAVKHGSLSRAKGQLDLNWSVARTGRGLTLALDWVEKNGPPARRPKRLGFGTRLVTLVIERQLNGEVTRSFNRKGLAVHMEVPLTHERWPTAAARAPDAESGA